jgi:hypothetical protein
MPVPNTFANATATIPLSELDANFATTITLGNTAIQLGNTVTTLNNMTMANVTISSTASAFPNNYLANSNVIVGNTTITLGSTVTSVGDLTLTNVTISSGNVTCNIANSSISNTSVANAASDSVNVVGFMGLPQNSQNGDYNIVLGDAGKHIYHPDGQAVATYTFPANSNVSFTVGTAVTIINGSANNVTIAMTTDTMTLANTSNTSSRTLVANGVATCVKITNTSWIISGAGLS